MPTRPPKTNSEVGIRNSELPTRPPGDWDGLLVGAAYMPPGAARLDARVFVALVDSRR